MSINTPVPGVVTKGSRHTIEETFERLGTTIRAKGLAIFAFIDHSGEAEKIGLKTQGAKLVIFGKAGTPLMIAYPLLALDLPLKALIWENNDWHVWVSYNSVSYLANGYNLQSELTKNIAGIDAIIDNALLD